MAKIDGWHEGNARGGAERVINLAQGGRRQDDHDPGPGLPAAHGESSELKTTTAGAASTADAVPLYVKVENAIAQAIDKQALVAGDVLTESAMSDVLEISRTPVKLAFERLLTRGLLQKGERRGFVVVGSAGQCRPRRWIRREDITRLIAARPAARSPAAWTSIYDEVELEVSAHSALAALRVKEGRLASAYKVSRTVAREVLTRLERLGLVEKDRQGRWFVVALTSERVEQMYEVRRYLEPPALRAAAARIPQGELRQMRERLMNAQQRYPAVSVTELDTLERDIHVDCIGYCGNPELMKLLRISQPTLITNKHMLGGYLKLPLEPFLDEHEVVLEYLERRDGEAAAKALEAHLTASVPRVLHRLAALKEAERPSAPPYLAEC